jgi:hypothetical protein
MHPPRSEHARSLHAFVAVCLLVGGGLGLGGCGPAEAPTARFLPADTLASGPPRDSVLAVLSSMRRAAFDSAFAVLGDYAVTRAVRTEQLDSSGAVTALSTAAVRYAPGTGAGRLLRRDSTGAFRGGGLLGGAAPTAAPTARPADLAAQMLPDQPAYVERRTREAYRYALRADTLRPGPPVYVLEARARSAGPGREQGLRYARLLLDRRSRELIGLTTVRAHEGLVFREHSRLSMRLRRLPDGRWGPFVTRVRARLQVPLHAPRHIRTVSAFYDYSLRS